MSGIIQYMRLSGAGSGYTRPGAAGVNIRSANQTPRWWAKDYGNSSMIAVAGVQNRADFSNYHAGVEAESVKAYKQNFQS